MKSLKQLTWIKIFAIISLLAGVLLLNQFKSSLYHPAKNIFTYRFYQWALFTMGGILLVLRKPWCIFAYTIVGITYILYDIFIFLACLFFGIFMNDTNEPAIRIFKMLFELFLMTIIFTFYWVVSMVYIRRAKEQFK